MGSVPTLLTFLLADLSGWGHRRQLLVIEFLQFENRMLKDLLRGKRIRFDGAERALLTRKAKAPAQAIAVAGDDHVSRRSDAVASEAGCISAFSDRHGPGRLGIMQEISQLIVRIAVDNPGWGYTRI